MKMLKCVAVTASVLVAIGGLFVLTARAAQSAPAEGALGGKWRERVKEKLDLSGDQLAQIKSQLKSEKDNIRSLLTRLQDARSSLRAEIQKPAANETSVREAAAKLSAVESDLAVERLKLHGKISPILTSEQRAKLAQLEAGLDDFIDRAINRVDAKLSE